MKHLLAVSLIASLFLFGCGGDESGVDLKSEVASKTFKLYPGAPGGDRGRLLWEATRAMVGPYQADYYQWNTYPTLASYAYVTEDSGAWNALLSSSSYGPSGYYVSCRRYSSQNPLYQPCYNVFGSFDSLPLYVIWNWTCDYGYRGGQCKAFTNLVAYRSGVYHGANWAFKPLPSDDQIYDRYQNGQHIIEWATPSNIQPGDILRSKEICTPSGCGRHSLIVARIYNSSQIVVIDSNWVRLNDPIHGNGCEQIGSHVMGFSGTNYNNLGNYFRLNCVYDGNCP